MEPVSYVFEKLCNNYRRWPSVVPLRGACWSEPGQAQISLGFGEDNYLAVAPRQGQRSRGAAAKNQTVPLLTLSGLWQAAVRASHKASVASASDVQAERPARTPTLPRAPDILVMDVEGSEAMCLLGGGGSDGVGPWLRGLRMLQPPPSLILFEAVWLTAANMSAIDTYLKARGYKMLAALRNWNPQTRTPHRSERLGFKTSLHCHASTRISILTSAYAHRRTGLPPIDYTASKFATATGRSSPVAIEKEEPTREEEPTPLNLLKCMAVSSCQTRPSDVLDGLLSDEGLPPDAGAPRRVRTLGWSAT